MQKIYIVTMATTQGPGGPIVSTYCHSDHQEALAAFTECEKALGDDPSTIELVELDLATMESKVINSFEGTFDDHMDQWGEAYEADQEEDDGICEGAP